MDKKKNAQNIVILGAGISGLTVSYFLNKFKIKNSVIEKQNKCGGLLKSFTIKKHVFDKCADDMCTELLTGNDVWYGAMICVNGISNGEVVGPLITNDVSNCSLDTTLHNAFKITKTRIITMVGNGVEFGTRNTTWLGSGGVGAPLGIVKDQLEVRWSEPYWVDEEQWSPYSRWELVERRQNSSGNSRGLLDRLSGKRRVSYEDFENVIEFNNEPFKRTRTAGLHRIGSLK